MVFFLYRVLRVPFQLDLLPRKLKWQVGKNCELLANICQNRGSAAEAVACKFGLLLKKQKKGMSAKSLQKTFVESPLRAFWRTFKQLSELSESLEQRPRPPKALKNLIAIVMPLLLQLSLLLLRCLPFEKLVKYCQGFTFELSSWWNIAQWECMRAWLNPWNRTNSCMTHINHATRANYHCCSYDAFLLRS